MLALFDGSRVTVQGYTCHMDGLISTISGLVIIGTVLFRSAGKQKRKGCKDR